MDRARAIEALFWSAGGGAAWKSRAFVVFALGAVDGEAPRAGRTLIVQPAKGQRHVSDRAAADIGEVASKTDFDLREGGPACQSVRVESLA
jgi:hypothetical protein